MCSRSRNSWFTDIQGYLSNPVTDFERYNVVGDTIFFARTRELGATLISGYLHPPVVTDADYPRGVHSAVLRSSGLPSGLYFYRLTTDTGVIQRKMLLMR